VFAWLYPGAIACYERYIHERKQRLFAELPRRVLEIGPGCGANFQFLPPGCEWTGIEPNPFFHERLRREARRLDLAIDVRHATAEAIDAADSSYEAVICTLVLCSVSDVSRVLAEIRRVLLPGGMLYFIEHVAAPRGTWLRRCQAAIRPVWKVVADGCCLDRETQTAIRAAGFRSVTCEEFRVPLPAMPPFASPHIAGVAVK
jgi:ubiquinone/menaquinone biosynthesis C-methylase UbiE